MNNHTNQSAPTFLSEAALGVIGAVGCPVAAGVGATGTVGCAVAAVTGRIDCGAPQAGHWLVVSSTDPPQNSHSLIGFSVPFKNF